MAEPEKIALEDRTEYRLNGKFHREDGPADIWKDGTKFWYHHGLRHREGGPALIWGNGDEEWWLNGLRHREDVPAVIWKDGTEGWYLHDKLHREDGPAIIRKDGTKEWWVEGIKLTEEEFETAKKILLGEYPFLDIPLLINHITLKYFALRKLSPYGT